MIHRSLLRLVSLVLALAGGGFAIGAPPPLRDQISLNGEWPIGGTVPVYAGLPKFDALTYERDVTVPAAWAGRVVQLEFGAVNFIARVFVDGTSVGENVGAWCPFAIDVTRFAVPGRTIRLKVEIQGPAHPPITDAAGNFAWPVGGWKDRGGIADDVWLRAYGVVHIADAFVQTSVAQRTLTVDYTVRNTSAASRTVSLAGEVAGIKLSGAPLTLAAGETKTVSLSAPAGEIALYWPDRPTLHVLTSRLLDGGVELDRETRRFGFREITLRGNQFYWNGVRVNLYGDYQTFGDTWYLDSAKLHTPEAWPATVDRIKAMNLRVLRWHHNPVPADILDVADEKGLLICSESANYGRDFHRKSHHAHYLAHALKTIAPWVRAERNHPSIYLWNATNEMTHSFTGPFAPATLVPLGEEIARLDPTRPVGYDGDTGRSNPVANPDPKELQRNRITTAALVLRTFKAGRATFAELRRFRLVGPIHASGPAPSRTVVFE